jgi:hypothetical protein
MRERERGREGERGGGKGEIDLLHVLYNHALILMF